MELLRGLFRRNLRTSSHSLQWEPTSPHVYTDQDGRRHRTDAPYLLPKDDKEIQRLDYQHFILRHILEGNTFAPVHDLLEQGGNVLDVGCGTGRWGHEIAASYSRCSVYGIDLEDVPRHTSTPLNCHFTQGNLLMGLPFASRTFIYTHQRLLVAGIPLDHWFWVIGELKRVTIPGGWIELVEMGNTFHNAGPATKQFLAWWKAISQMRRIDASQMSLIGLWLRQSGLKAVRAETKQLAVGKWGGRTGNLLVQNILAGWPTMRPLAQSWLSISPEEFNTVMGHLEDEWNTYHTTYEVYFACGQV